MAGEKSKTPWGVIVTTIVGGLFGFSTGGIGSIIFGLLAGLLGGFAVQAGLDAYLDYQDKKAKEEGKTPDAPGKKKEGDGKGTGKDGKTPGKDGPGEAEEPPTKNEYIEALEHGRVINPNRGGYDPKDPASTLEVRSSLPTTVGILGTGAAGTWALMRWPVQPAVNGFMSLGPNWALEKAFGRRFELHYGIPGFRRTPLKLASDATEALDAYRARQGNAELTPAQKALTSGEARLFRKTLGNKLSKKLLENLNPQNAAQMNELAKAYSAEHPGWLRSLFMQEAAAGELSNNTYRFENGTWSTIEPTGNEQVFRIEVPGKGLVDPYTMHIDRNADIGEAIRAFEATPEEIAEIKASVKKTLLDDAKARIEAESQGKTVTPEQKAAALESVGKAIDECFEGKKTGSTPAKLSADSMGDVCKTALDTATGKVSPVAVAPATPDVGAFKSTTVDAKESFSIRPVGETEVLPVEKVSGNGLDEKTFRSEKGKRYFKVDGDKVVEITNGREARLAEAVRSVKGVDPAVLEKAAFEVYQHGRWASGENKGATEPSAAETKFWQEATPEKIAEVIKSHAEVVKAHPEGTPLTSVSDIVVAEQGKAPASGEPAKANTQGEAAKSNAPDPVKPTTTADAVAPEAFAKAFEGMNLPNQSDVLKALSEIKTPELVTLRDSLSPGQLQEVGRAYDAALAKAKSTGQPVESDVLMKEMQRVKGNSIGETGFAGVRKSVLSKEVPGAGYVFHGIALLTGGDQLAKGMKDGDWKKVGMGGGMMGAGGVGATAETLEKLQVIKYRAAYNAALTQLAAGGSDISKAKTIADARKIAGMSAMPPKVSAGLGGAFGLMELGIGGKDIYDAYTMDDKNPMKQYNYLNYTMGGAHLVSGTLITTSSAIMLSPALAAAAEGGGVLGAGLSGASSLAGPVGVVVMVGTGLLTGIDIPFTDIHLMDGLLPMLEKREQALAENARRESTQLRAQGTRDINKEFIETLVHNRDASVINQEYTGPKGFVATTKALASLKEWEFDKLRKSNSLTEEKRAEINARFNRVWTPDELSDALKVLQTEVREKIETAAKDRKWDPREVMPEAYTDELVSDEQAKANAKTRSELMKEGVFGNAFWWKDIVNAFGADVKKTDDKLPGDVSSLEVLAGKVEQIKAALVEVNGTAVVKNEKTGKDEPVFYRRIFKTLDVDGRPGTTAVYEDQYNRDMKDNPTKYEGMSIVSKRIDKGPQGQQWSVIVLGKVVEDTDQKRLDKVARLPTYRSVYNSTLDFQSAVAKQSGEQIKAALAEQEKTLGTAQITQSAQAMDKLFAVLEDPNKMVEYNQFAKDPNFRVSMLTQLQQELITGEKKAWQSDQVQLPWKGDKRLLGLGVTGVPEIDDYFAKWSAYKRVQGSKSEIAHIKDSTTRQFLENSMRLEALGATQAVVRSAKSADLFNETLDAQYKRIEDAYAQLDKAFSVDKDIVKATGWEAFRSARGAHAKAMAQISLMEDGEVKTALTQVARSNMLLAMPQIDERMIAAVKTKDFVPTKQNVATLFNVGKDPSGKDFNTGLMRPDAAPEMAMAQMTVFKQLKDVAPEDRFKKLHSVVLGELSGKDKEGSGFRGMTQQGFADIEKSWKLTAMQGDQQLLWVRAYVEAKKKASGKPEDNLAKLVEGKGEEEQQKIIKAFAAGVDKEAKDIIANVENGKPRTAGPSRLQEAENDFRYFTFSSYLKREMPWLNEAVVPLTNSYNVPLAGKEKDDALKVREEIVAKRKAYIDRYMAANDAAKMGVLMEELALERTKVYLAQNTDEALQHGYLPLNAARQLGSVMTADEIEKKLGFKVLAGASYDDQRNFVSMLRNMDTMPEKMPELVKKFQQPPSEKSPKLVKVVPIMERTEVFDYDLKTIKDAPRVKKDSVTKLQVTYQDEAGATHTKIMPYTRGGFTDDDHMTHVVLAAMDPKAALKRQLEQQGLTDVVITQDGGKTIVEVTDNRKNEHRVNERIVDLDKDYRDKFSVEAVRSGKESEAYKKLEAEYKYLRAEIEKEQLTQHPNNDSRRYRFVGTLEGEKIETKDGVETLKSAPEFVFEKLQWKDKDNQFVDAVPPTLENKQGRPLFRESEDKIKEAKAALAKAGLPASLIDFNYFVESGAGRFAIGDSSERFGRNTMGTLLKSAIDDDRNRVSFAETDARQRARDNFERSIGTAVSKLSESEMSADGKSIMVKARISILGNKYSDYRNSESIVEVIKDVSLETRTIRKTGEKITMDVEKSHEELQKAMFDDAVSRAPVARVQVTKADKQVDTFDLKGNRITSVTADRQTRDMDVAKGVLTITMGDNIKREIDMKTGKMTVTNGDSRQEIDLSAGRQTIERADGLKQELEWRGDYLVIHQKGKEKIELSLGKSQSMLAEMKEIKSPEFHLTFPNATQSRKYIGAEVSSSSRDGEVFDEQAKMLLLTMNARTPLYSVVPRDPSPAVAPAMIAGNPGSGQKGTTGGTGAGTDTAGNTNGTNGGNGTGTAGSDANGKDVAGKDASKTAGANGKGSIPAEDPNVIAARKAAELAAQQQSPGATQQVPPQMPQMNFVPPPESAFWMQGGAGMNMGMGNLPQPGQPLPGGKFKMLAQGNIGGAMPGAPGGQGMGGAGMPGGMMQGPAGPKQVVTLEVTDPNSPFNGQQINLIGEAKGGLLYVQELNGQNFGPGRVVIDMRNPNAIEAQIQEAITNPFNPQMFTPNPAKQPLPPAFQGPAPQQQNVPVVPQQFAEKTSAAPKTDVQNLASLLLGELIPSAVNTKVASLDPKNKDKGQGTPS